MAAGAFLLATAIALRVVSLAPALTDDLFAIGAGGAVVGVDADARRPPAVLRLPRVGSMRTINSEAIAALDPDLIVGIPYQLPNLRDLGRTGVRTEALAVDTLQDDFAAITTLGRLTGHAREAARALTAIRARLARAERRTQTARPLRAFVLIGVNPTYTAAHGSYIDDLLCFANITNVAGTVHAAFPEISDESVEAADPDVIVVPHGTLIPDGPPWSRLRAVRRHRVVAIDEDDLLQPGPRVADVVDALVRGTARYRGRAGGDANAKTPSRSCRTPIGMP